MRLCLRCKAHRWPGVQGPHQLVGKYDLVWVGVGCASRHWLRLSVPIAQCSSCCLHSSAVRCQNHGYHEHQRIISSVIGTPDPAKHVLFNNDAGNLHSASPLQYHFRCERERSHTHTRARSTFETGLSFTSLPDQLWHTICHEMFIA